MNDKGYGYAAAHVGGTPNEVATGVLELCDASDSECESIDKGGICLYVKHAQTQIADLVEKCEKADGAGMVIFTNSQTGPSFDTWTTSSASIPVIAVKTMTGRALLGETGEQVTIGDVLGNEIEYSYAFLTGTSMASPHVAAAAALLWSHFPECSNHQIRYALAATASHPDGSNSCDDRMGYGIVKVKDAFDWLSDDPCDTWDVSQISTGGCTTLHQ